MRGFPPTLALGITLTLTLALSGCAGGIGIPGVGSDRDPGSPDDATGGEDNSPTACVIGTWTADVVDLAEQLGQVLGETGMDVITTRAAGTQTMTFTGEGGFTFANDVAFAVDVQIGGGPTLTAAQNHSGTTTASWRWDSSSVVPAMMFADFDDSAYAVENTVSMEGVASTIPIEIPPIVSAGGRLFVTCLGDQLITTWEEGLFITAWSRG
jgi:hypothetical protein